MTADATGPDQAERRFFLRGRIVSGGSVTAEGVVAVDGRRIAYAGPAAGFDVAARGRAGYAAVSLPAGCLLLPGLVDLHCHGAYGGDFSTGSEAAARRAVEFLHRGGTTTLLASTVSASPAELAAAMVLLGRLAGEELIAGIHAEGPFLSPARRGAHHPDALLLPDPDLAAALVRAAGGHLAAMTYAPELPGAEELVRLLARNGVVPSVGHTDADSATTAASLALAGREMAAAGLAGRRPTVTHLFNGMPVPHHRSPGPVPACLRTARAGRAVVELIADGVHLDAETVLSVFELAGAGNIALVTDSVAAAGLGDGSYRLGPHEVTVRNGVAGLPGGGALAGGTATLAGVLARTVAAGVPLQDAVTAATAVPAGVLGLTSEVGALAPGLLADVLVTDAGLRPAAVLRRGAWILPPPR